MQKPTTTITTARRILVFADNFPVHLLYQGESWTEMARTYDRNGQPVEVLYRAADGRNLLVRCDFSKPSDAQAQ